MGLFQKSKKKKEDLYMGLRLNITAQFPRPISYPELERVTKYITDVTKGILSFNGDYEKTFSSPSLPLLQHEPRRFYTNTRTNNIRGTISDNQHVNTLVFKVKEKMEEQKVTFTGIEFILDSPEVPPLTEKQNEFLMLVKRSVSEYFENYKK